MRGGLQLLAQAQAGECLTNFERKYLPEIDRYLEENFRVAYRVGAYKVLRKRRSE